MIQVRCDKGFDKLQSQLVNCINADASLAEELNNVITCFQSPRTVTPVVNHQSSSLIVHKHQVRHAVKVINPQKATRRERVLTIVLCTWRPGYCRTSLSLAEVLSCLKAATIIPKRTIISGLSDYRPVALASVVIGNVVLQYLKTRLPESHDKHQFAYRVNWSTDDTIITTLHTTLNHMEQQALMPLFVDNSWGFIIAPSLTLWLTQHWLTGKFPDYVWLQ